MIEPKAPDGRHARSDRTRTAIVDALLALLEAGELRPPAERIAERAGVSRRALFNHFRDVEDLFATVAQRQLERVLPTLRPLPTGGPTAARAEACVAQMTELFARVAPIRRAALLVEHESPAIGASMAAARRLQRAAVEGAFAPELDAAPPGGRAELCAGLAAALSFSYWNELRTAQGLEEAEAARAVRRTVDGLLSSLPPHPPTQEIP